ncbi:MAG: hypothetical protein ABI481_01245 [Pyrinomonadaceae bacterium]
MIACGAAGVLVVGIHNSWDAVTDRESVVKVKVEATERARAD